MYKKLFIILATSFFWSSLPIHSKVFSTPAPSLRGRAGGEATLLPNTFGISAKCTKLLEFSTLEELKAYYSEIAEARNQGKLLVIGRGSNLLPTGDYDGLVVRSRIMGKTLCRIGSLPTEGSPMLITSEYVPSGGRGRHLFPYEEIIPTNPFNSVSGQR